jgi:phage terminase small subunit
MPALDNVRHERFCLALFGDASASATHAYKKAGYAPANNNVAAVNAWHLLRNPKIKARLDELKQEQAKAASLTREEILERILEAHELAIARGQAAGALRALEMLGQELHGMFKGHAQVDVSARMREMTDAELLAALHRNLAILGILPLITDQPGEDFRAGQSKLKDGR